MATLQKIRNHGVTLLIIVGLAMFAFIFGDFLNSGSSFFNRDREYVGEIEGHSVHYTEYEAAKDQLTEVYKIESGRSDFDEDMNAQIRNQVWQMMLADWTLRAAAERIGMEVTTDELSDLCIGAHPHQLITQRRAFMDQDGQFSRNILVNFLSQIDREDENGSQGEYLKQLRSYWMYWENAVRLTHLQEKYTGLMQNLVTANKLDAKYAFEARNSMATVSYVCKPYSAIADSLINVTDGDIKKMYNSRKMMYKQEPNRALEYVTFNVVPSEQDSIEAYEAIAKVIDEFKTTDDVALVVNTNSDTYYNGQNYSENTIPEMYREFAFGKGAKAGDVTELSYDPANRTFSIARIVEAGYSIPDSVELKAIAMEEGQEDRELGWVSEMNLRMVNSDFADKALSCKRGQRFNFDLGQGEQTYEVMEIAAATPKAKVAILERKVTASSKTYSAIYNQAKQFIVNNNTEELFRQGAEEARMPMMPAYHLNKNTEKVAQLKNSRPIVRWAFEAEKEGQISDVFDCGEQYVVALLTEIKDGDYRPISDVEAELTQRVMNNKKAEMIIAEMKSATTLDEANAVAQSGIKTAEGITLGSPRFGNFSEPAVVGTIFAMNPTEVSAPIKGNMGVYMIQPTLISKNDAEMNVEQEIMQLNMYISYSLGYQIMNILNEQADVEDNRANFQ